MNLALNELTHHYGSNVHILNDRCALAWLARLCAPETYQPQINTLVEHLYHHLMTIVASREFKAKDVSLITRMTAMHPDQKWEGTITDPEQRAVVVNLARAGTFPSHICYSLLNNLLNPALVRQDHILAARTTNENEQVTGSHLSGHKIGGDVDGAVVLFPDPMGATGSTIVSTLNHYKNVVGGRANRYIALHLIVTPEYLKNVLSHHPDLTVYAIRLDRGLSPKDVLQAPPGQFWDQERGLNDKHYIVPGGGGFGEIMNNSFV